VRQHSGMSDMPNVASVAIFSGDAVLLIQRAFAPYAGFWTLPGGRIEPGETAESAVRREIGEELGLEVDALAYVTEMEMRSEPPYRLAVFACRLKSGIPQPSAEIADWRWIAPSGLSELKTTPHLAGIVADAALLAPAV
jgi:8-oxo-dGTP diphosphatase